MNVRISNGIYRTNQFSFYISLETLLSDLIVNLQLNIQFSGSFYNRSRFRIKGIINVALLYKIIQL